MAVERRVVTNDPTLVEAELRSVVGTVWVPCDVLLSDDESGNVLVRVPGLLNADETRAVIVHVAAVYVQETWPGGGAVTVEDL